MRICVVDASAISALLFGEPRAEKVADILEGARLAAPALLWFEIASVCLKKVATHPSKEKELFSVFGLLGRLAIDRVEVAHLETIRLAQETGLTTYDASYLWMAKELNGELITLDEKLAQVMDSM
ncbi:MAG: type II toxin-antitoxin system VapC family toxin [bacterium]|nr:MAG: type II toxin-antitoxin system VapC family toxin [bacterium]